MKSKEGGRGGRYPSPVTRQLLSSRWRQMLALRARAFSPLARRIVSRAVHIKGFDMPSRRP